MQLNSKQLVKNLFLTKLVDVGVMGGRCHGGGRGVGVMGGGGERGRCHSQNFNSLSIPTKVILLK